MPRPCTAVVFPGQGSQRQGMGRDFYDQFLPARRAYEEASEALHIDLPALCFEPDDRLNLTEYAQPAILATEMAMFRAVQAEFDLAASHYGGHSLGEYTALVAAGALSLGGAVEIVRERGRLMQAAVPVGRGCMVAAIGEGLDLDAIQIAIKDLRVSVANDNSPNQIVLSGLVEDMDAARQIISETAGTTEVRFVELEVSAPFHSPLMSTIEPAFKEVLRSMTACFHAGAAPVVTSNYSGGFHDADTASVIEKLTRQVSNTVRWRNNMEALTAHRPRVIEIGPGRPLRGFFKAIGVDAECITSVTSAQRITEGGRTHEVP
jgi:[acyl-carrier-protein] S-malonyltransferase